MLIVSKVVAGLALEILFGTALWSIASGALWRSGVRRRWRAVSVGGARALRPLAWIAAGALAIAFAVHLAAGGDWRAAGLLDMWPSTWPFVLAGSLPATGSYLLVHAGVLEAAGRVRRARREVRLAGFVVFGGAFAQLLVVWGDLLFRQEFKRAIVVESPEAGMLLVVAMLLSGVGAFAALLAGLSGKPRPVGQWAALLYLGALVGLVVSAQWATTPLLP